MTYRIVQGRRFRSTDNTLKPIRTRVVPLTRTRTEAQQLACDTRAVNRALGAMPTYHDSVPLEDVNFALRGSGFDELEDMLLCGAQGSLHEPVGRNRWLALSWYKMESGRYEVIAYVS